MIHTTSTQIIAPHTFERENHWYPRAMNASIHPMANFFFNLSTERLINRYAHLHPMVSRERLEEFLGYKPKYFFWSGADLINVTSANGKRQMVVIETNSCPSGQKSMPLRDENQEMGGYRALIEETFLPLVRSKRQSQSGVLAVLYDKNPVEASGYAHAMADVFEEPVFFVPCYHDQANPDWQWEDGVLSVRSPEDETWHKVRAAFRYVTQKPWNRLPILSKTFVFNPSIACLAGGRNKLVAAKAYDFLNGKLLPFGLQINTPQTIWDVSKVSIPLWVEKLGGQAVIKVPYSNAGQGVFTIVRPEELDAFMELDFEYDKFIVQSLIGNYHWSSISQQGRLYHVGTLPDKKGNSYVADLRMMIHHTNDGFRPLAIYARRALLPLPDSLDVSTDSWEILGTNLSIKTDTGWDSDTNRLLMMDQKDYNKLGLGMDDLIEAFMQTLLSTIAIDKMCEHLISTKGTLKQKLFTSFNNDPHLLSEILLR
ncbi:MAG: hypothetical protein ACFCUI_06055 [Bernardetiaceae bacterium]